MWLGSLRWSSLPSLPHLSAQWMTTSPTNVGSPHPLPFLPGAGRHGQQTAWPCWVETQTHWARLSRTITTFALLSVLQVGDNLLSFFLPSFLSSPEKVYSFWYVTGIVFLNFRRVHFMWNKMAWTENKSTQWHELKMKMSSGIWRRVV